MTLHEKTIHPNLPSAAGATAFTIRDICKTILSSLHFINNGHPHLSANVNKGYKVILIRVFEHKSLFTVEK
jgi:hypothetical protein